MSIKLIINAHSVHNYADTGISMLNIIVTFIIYDNVCTYLVQVCSYISTKPSFSIHDIRTFNDRIT